jgi:low temperature requirement protein LtrA
VPGDEDHSVTTLELFFDLVFVFAITQVTAFMAAELGWRSALRGFVLLALLWWRGAAAPGWGTRHTRTRGWCGPR